MRLLVVMAFFITFSCWGQVGMHQWKLHANTAKSIEVCGGGNKVIAAYTNGLVEYDLIHKERSLLTKTNYLSDVFINTLHFNQADASFWVGYQNGNIDKIKNETVVNLSALKMSSSITSDKNILKFESYGSYTYAATSFGILKIDYTKMEVRDTYYPPLGDAKIVDFTFFNDTIYVLSTNSLFKAHYKHSLLANPDSWINDKRISWLNTIENLSICQFNNKLLVHSLHKDNNTDSTYILDNQSIKSLKKGVFSLGKYIANLKSQNGELFVSIYDGAYILDSNYEIVESVYNYQFNKTVRPNTLIKYSGSYWIADNVNGLVKWNNNYDNISIKEVGPPKNSFFAMDSQNNSLVVAGGILSKASFAFNTGGAYIYKDDTWELFDRWNQNLWLDKNIWDVCATSINPSNSNQIAFGSNSFVPLSIMNNGKFIDQIFDNTNSPLESSSLGNKYTCIADLAYDKTGNLWMLNSFTNNPLKVYTKDNQWFNFDLGSASKNAFARKIIIDFKSNKWITFPGIGIIGYNDNGTIADFSDDHYRIINENPNSGSLPSREVTALAIDFNDELWIGTDNGFCILYNASGILDGSIGSFDAQRIKERVEGNVEYLLGKTAVSDIEIDGGNRKWIATANAGLFLLSSDGSQIISSFTAENSPLISNNILDIKLNQTTGELFIITDLGLVSYRTDASYEDPTYATAKVFPNPFKPEHTSGITIQGILYDSDVKFTDAEGNVVYKTTSNGGTAFWNARNFQGERVSPGVYFIWTASNNGNGKKVGKVVIL